MGAEVLSNNRFCGMCMVTGEKFEFKFILMFVVEVNLVLSRDFI